MVGVLRKFILGFGGDIFVIVVCFKVWDGCLVLGWRLGIGIMVEVEVREGSDVLFDVIFVCGGVGFFVGCVLVLELF